MPLFDGERNKPILEQCQVCALSPRERSSEAALALAYGEAPGRPLPDGIVQPGLSYDEVLHDDFRFDLNAHDVMVFLHIQKTGGTSFGRHLVMDLDLKCRARDRGGAIIAARGDAADSWKSRVLSKGNAVWQPDAVVTHGASPTPPPRRLCTLRVP
ncbi:Heparan-sulfate 6-O-sulfotransferase 1 [Eumeta japonica]|uniref:Heparan-sulfate 6-O-sulfotransferase n=1 Tax=Eumeta variegata TaxID=151549 RepID=A0A4C1VSB1_EUMVA|nr:Heparan-sulfate 6-O-sulfotransferase 1 [Eumeta japonica]